jgi:inorganic pyrophosphatase
MDTTITVYIEIEKDSNIKYEINRDTNKLEIDRILPYPYYYPYCYGYIVNTMAQDNDELDALIITDTKLKNDNYYNVYIIGVLIMEDEKGLDEKILCVLEDDYEKINNLYHLSTEIKNNIDWFFSNYKTKTPNKLSKVIRFGDKKEAIKLYNQYSLMSS